MRADQVSSIATSALEREVTELFEEFRSPLLRYLMSLGVGVQDGEEIVQEVFLALFNHLRNGKPRHNLRGWIFRVGHNQALKLRESNRARVLDTVDDSVDSHPDLGPTPEEQALMNQRQRRLEAVVRALPPQDRACLSLRAEGFRYREIAEIVGISLGAVASSLELSLAKLSCVQER